MTIKADLVPYTEEYQQSVHSWIESEETYLSVCRGKEFPPPENLVKNWQREGVSSFLLFSENKPVAYGELWSRSSEMANEIAHVIVDPAKRSEGYGAKIIDLLFKRGINKPGIAKVIANLYSENPIALGCFMKTGFELVGTTTYTEGLRLVKMGY